MRLCIWMGLACALALTASAQADLVVVWTFGGSATTYTLAPQFDATGGATLDAGGGSLDATGGNGVAFTDAGGNSRGAGQCLHWSDTTKSAGDAYVTITLNTTGWQNLDLRWDYKSKYDTSKSKGGPVQFDLDYNIGGGWLPLANNRLITCDSAFHWVDLDLSAFTDLNNQASVQIKLHNLKEGTLPDGDYWQDNIQLTGTPIPEPVGLSLLALGGLALLRRRK
jgi:MYXO-CTERM domain-containing protein